MNFQDQPLIIVGFKQEFYRGVLPRKLPGIRRGLRPFI